MAIMPRSLAPYRVLKVKLTKKQQKQLIKRSVLIMAVIEPAMTLPQVLEIWVKQEASGVSDLTWGFYIFAAFVWLLYGLQIKDKPLIIASILWVLMESAVFIGALIYG